jgi:hypothetical protein
MMTTISKEQIMLNDEAFQINVITTNTESQNKIVELILETKNLVAIVVVASVMTCLDDSRRTGC